MEAKRRGTEKLLNQEKPGAKRTGNKQNEAKKSKRNEKEPKNCLPRKLEGRFYTCISTVVLMYQRLYYCIAYSYINALACLCIG